MCRPTPYCARSCFFRALYHLRHCLGHMPGTRMMIQFKLLALCSSTAVNTLATDRELLMRNSYLVELRLLFFHEPQAELLAPVLCKLAASSGIRNADLRGSNTVPQA